MKVKNKNYKQATFRLIFPPTTAMIALYTTSVASSGVQHFGLKF